MVVAGSAIRISEGDAQEEDIYWVYATFWHRRPATSNIPTKLHHKEPVALFPYRRTQYPFHKIIIKRKNTNEEVDISIF